MKTPIDQELKAKLLARIAAAEAVLHPFYDDSRRQSAEADSESHEWTPGIADAMDRAYCFRITGFANYRTRPESHGWYYLAKEAKDALRIADDSDDARMWCMNWVGKVEQAAEIANEVLEERAALKQ